MHSSFSKVPSRMLSKISVVSPSQNLTGKVDHEDLPSTKRTIEKRSSALDLVNMFRAQQEARKLRKTPASSSFEIGDGLESCDSAVKSRAFLEPPKPKISPIIRQKSFNARS